MTSNIDIAEKVRPIDVFLFDDVDLLDVLGSLPVFGVAVVNGRKGYEIRYVLVDGARLLFDAPLSSETNSDDLLV